MDQEKPNIKINEAPQKEVLNNNKLNINNTLLAVIGVLVIMSAVQVFQLQNLISAISSGNVRASSQVSGGSSLDLPSQVGGCG